MPLFPPALPAVPAPGDQGLLAWAGDPAAAVGGVTISSGAVYTVRVTLPAGGTVSKVWMVISTAGGTLTAGQNFLGLYNAAGTRVGVTADQTTAFGSAQILGAALTAPYVAAGGHLFVAVLCNGGSPITLASMSGIAAGGVAIGNAGLAGADGYRFGFAATGQTALPASFDPTAIIPNITANFWAAIS